MCGRLWIVAGLALCLQVPKTAAGAGVGPKPVVERPFVIVIDPGHGGENTGCIGFDGSREKDVNLALSLQLRDELGHRLPKARVVLTRDEDRTVALSDRVALANHEAADLLVSLHANASPHAVQQGFETYVLDAKTSALEAARLARRANDAQRLEPVPPHEQAQPSVMIRQLSMTRDRLAATRLAAGVQREQRERFPERLDRGVKEAPFDVLMGARMPAILFEAGFLDHANEGALLIDAEQRARIAEGLADAIVDHYRWRGR